MEKFRYTNKEEAIEWLKDKGFDEAWEDLEEMDDGDYIENGDWEQIFINKDVDGKINNLRYFLNDEEDEDMEDEFEVEWEEISDN